jgi:hypothetical protein
MSTDQHHRWVPDRERTGFTCLEHPGESGWDWHVGEVRRLRAQVKAQDEVVKAARAFWMHYQRGQSGTPDSLYPMTDATLDAWYRELDRLLDDMVVRLNAATAAESPARE